MLMPGGAAGHAMSDDHRGFPQASGIHRTHHVERLIVCDCCGSELRRGARFCDACGAPVALPHKAAEYKQVTVLFADVVRSMDIAAALGAERLREIMTELFKRSTVVVERYGGIVDKFTGDGIMALFGAPVALEDHALRACLAAQGLQDEAARLAVEISKRDTVELRLRVGLDSGRVVAGAIGSNPVSYTAIGEHVGMAQRMESVAPPGGVMLSKSTALLVEAATILGEPELVHIKGSDAPVSARRLVSMAAERGRARRNESTLVGRQWEMSAVGGLLERSIEGHGGIVGLVGLPGIGKSRLVRESAALATSLGVEVFWGFCESHARELPFHVVAGLLRAAIGVDDMSAPSARKHVRARIPGASREDLLLLGDLLGIADPDVSRPDIDPDARRRRLTALVNDTSLARTTPALYIIEDAHWIDEVSESMLADFMAVIPQTRSMVLVSYRPEYRGALSRAPGAHTIALAPLGVSPSLALTTELLGRHPSVSALVSQVATRATGNPFFTEEIVRDLAERGVLKGHRGGYACLGDVDDVSVPPAIQATVAARIDRLAADAKQTLNAAAVIGSQFTEEMLSSLIDNPALVELLDAELIEQVTFNPRAEYAFRHPLIRIVGYDSQLKSARAELHRRLAAAIEGREVGLRSHRGRRPTNSRSHKNG
jgi:class 3 adenylate cyclase